MGENFTIDRRSILAAVRNEGECCTNMMKELFPKAFENVKGYYINENTPLWLGYSEDGVKVKDVVDVGGFLNTRHQISDLTIHDRRATKEEVKERLITAAKKSGLWYSKIDECMYHGNIHTLNNGKFMPNYGEIDDTLWSKNGCIYNKGKWATPLKETMPSKLKELIYGQWLRGNKEMDLKLKTKEVESFEEFENKLKEQGINLENEGGKLFLLTDCGTKTEIKELEVQLLMAGEEVTLKFKS